MVIGAASYATYYLMDNKSEPVKDSTAQDTRYVKASKVKIVEAETEMVYRGRVSAYDNVSLSSEVTGRILQGDVRFKDGESFRKGQTLIRIYDEDVIAALKSGKSSLLQTVSLILPDIMVDYPEQFEKWSSFFAKIDPEKPLPKLPEIVTDKERVYLASNNVLTTYYTLQQQEINLKRYVIKAPFTGFFKTVNKEIGAVASPGTELANIIRSDKLEIVVPVFPSDIEWVNVGDVVTITDNIGNQQTAEVSRIAGFVDQNTQSVNVYLTYNTQPGNELLEGEYVDITFVGANVSGFSIPREALIDGSNVYELTSNKLVKIPVKVVRQLDDFVLISGINDSATIVVESLASVNPSVKYLAR